MHLQSGYEKPYKKVTYNLGSSLTYISISLVFERKRKNGSREGLFLFLQKDRRYFAEGQRTGMVLDIKDRIKQRAAESYLSPDTSHLRSKPDFTRRNRWFFINFEFPMLHGKTDLK